MNVPDEFRYTKEHEWVRFDEDAGEVTIGITDFAQSELGDIVFLELPDTGEEFGAGDVLGTIEAVKTVADIYAPVSGEVIAVNEHLEDSPESVNEEPYDEGWILRMSVAEPDELDSLLNAEAYKELVE